MKTTEELENEILDTEDIDEFIAGNEEELMEMDLSEYLLGLLIKYDVEKVKVLTTAQMLDTNYGYEIFRGDKKNVSRDKLIQMSFGFPLTLKDTQNLLRLGNVRQLYARDKRDAYIMFAINKGYTIEQVEDLLYENSLKSIIG